MNKKIFLTLCIASAVCFGSCSNNDDNPAKDIYEAVSASSFSYVSDKTTGVGKVYEGATYRVTYDNAKLTATVKMENVRFADSEQPRSLIFSNVPWRFDNRTKARIIDVDRLTPDGASGPLVTDLDIVTLAKATVGDTDMDGMAVSYDVDGAYEVTNVPYHAVFAGTTETVNNNSQNSFVSTDPIYTVDINPANMTAVLKIAGAKFDPNMPALGVMEFAGLDATIVDGGYVLTSASLVPTIAGTPYPRYAITNLRMKAELDGETDLEFTCMGVFSVNAVFEGAYTPAD